MRRGALVLLAALSAPGSALAAHFKDATDTSLPAPACSGGGCYTSALVIADIDGDGHLDALYANGGGYYEKGDAEPAIALRNRGDGTFEDVSAAWLGGISSRVRQVAVGDVDGDGRLDVLVPGGYGVDQDRLFMQREGGELVDEASTRLPGGQASRAGAAHLGDLDGDGDLDMLITDWGDEPLSSQGALHLLVNDGEGHFAQAPAGALPPPVDAAFGNTPIDVDVADIDGDLDLDIIVDNRNGRGLVYVNDGKGRFSDDSKRRLPVKQGPYAYNTEACDIDGDGDLDLLLDNAAGDLGSGHRTQVLVNDGKGVFRDESAARVIGEPNTDDNAVKCVDVDDDGDYDLVVASLAGASEKLLVNDGTGTFTYAKGAFPKRTDPTLGLDVGDLDGDGRYDVLTGQGESEPRDERAYLGVDASLPDTHPPVVRRVTDAPDPAPHQRVVIVAAVTDGATSETGQHASVELLVGKGDGPEKSMPMRFVGGDLFRAELEAPGPGVRLRYRVRAVDRRGYETLGALHERVATGGGGASGASGASGAAGKAGAGAHPAAGHAGAGQGGASEGEAGASGAAGAAGAGGLAGAGGAAGASGEGGGAGAGGSRAAVGGGGAAGRPVRFDGDSCSVMHSRGASTPWPQLSLAALALLARLRRRRR